MAWVNREVPSNMVIKSMGIFLGFVVTSVGFEVVTGTEIEALMGGSEESLGVLFLRESLFPFSSATYF